MNTLRFFVQLTGKLILLASLILLSQPPAATGAADQTFDLLQIGTRTYTNVTVTTKEKSYVFVVHSGGMGTFKVADLSPEVRQQLGYVVAEKPKAGTNAATAWAKQTFARIETPQIKEVEKQVEQRWRACFPNGRPTLPPVDKTALWLVLGAVLLGYLFFSYCCQLICQKAGKQPGIMAWLPLLQQIALLHAAEMSGWWFLAGFVPVLNLVAAIIWCFKIARTRGKSAWVGLLLLLPVTTLFAFLYLAFSDRVPRKEKSKRLVQVMSLEIA